MKKILITTLLIIILILSGCNTEYNKEVKDFRNLFNNTMELLDSENVYQSIEKNNLTLNAQQLSTLLKKIEENAPSSKVKELMVLKQQCESINDIIEKGLRWDALDDLDKLSVKERIKILSPTK